MRFERARTLYPIISIILAGGKGTRMHSADRHKVCFDINGRPAIVRALDTYQSCGIEQHVIVVGALAGQVVETVGKHYPGAIYAYQAEQLGTGHATKQGAAVLSALRYEGAVLVVAGDRLLDGQVVDQLITEYRTSAADLVFLVGARSGSELGHVVRDPDGAVLGIVEHRDMLARKALAQIRRLALAALAPTVAEPVEAATPTEAAATRPSTSSGRAATVAESVEAAPTPAGPTQAAATHPSTSSGRDATVAEPVEAATISADPTQAAATRPSTSSGRAATVAEPIEAATTPAGPAQAADLAAAVAEIMTAAFPDARKAELAFGELWRRVAASPAITPEEVLALVPEAHTVFHLGNARQPHLTLTPEEVDRSQEVNQSVYLIKAPALFYALERLNTDNAQHEEYLSDIVGILAQAHENGRPCYSVRALPVADPSLVMGFNNPAELLEIENTLRAKEAAAEGTRGLSDESYKPVREWQALFADLTSPLSYEERGEVSPHSLAGNGAGELGLHAQLTFIYGDHPNLLHERLDAYCELLEACAATLGPDRRILLARAPGRINIMGRHVDHQGGHTNLMAIDREVLLAASARDDDEVRLYNVRADQFAPRRFSMGELLARLTWDDWLSLVNSEAVQEMVAQSGGDWAQYVRAAVLRLQKHYHGIKLRGLDLVVHGTVPVAAGLSSSSALVVATAEAVVALNGLDTRPRQFVDLCGEGEWFVGTRGGAADHAAMKFGQRDAVINVGFFPFAVGESVPFPPGHRMVFCNSHIKAQKAASAREVFNQRIACYRIGFQLIRRLYPQYAPFIAHLRDVNTRNLPIRLVDLYRMLLKLPERATRAELAEMLPEAVLQPLLGSQWDPETRYPVRGVVLFGLAESERSRVAPQYLRSGDLAGFGRLMRISHNGDRVVEHDASWQPHPYQGPCSNAYLLDLMADLESGEPERVLAAQLHLQPGAYACSMSELDLIVDTALRTEGVIGAQLAGAGLGGGVMALVREDAVGELERALVLRYYEPRGLAPAVLPCVPIAGSGVLAVEGCSNVSTLARWHV